MESFLSKKMKLSDPKGGLISDFPVELQVREMPIKKNEQLALF